MTDAPDAAQAARNLSRSVEQLTDSTRDYVRARFSELGDSMGAERRRALSVLVASGTLALLAIFGLFFAGLAIIIAFWDTHRTAAAVAVAAGYFALAGIAALVVRANQRESSAVDWIAQLVMLIAGYGRLRR